MERAYIYGDSLLKATVPDGDMRYHFHLPEIMACYPSRRLEVVNRAKMGATVTKGLSLVEHDIARGMDARWALLGYGGNDSDFDWGAIAAAPEEAHSPRTTLPEFVDTLHRAAELLEAAGVQPVLMTLPPIDSQRYFSFITRNGGGEGILAWLGEIGSIYRCQEMYSDAIAALAAGEGIPLIDVRRQFLPLRDLPRYIAADGIHLTIPGYRRLFDTLADWVREQLP